MMKSVPVATYRHLLRFPVIMAASIQMFYCNLDSRVDLCVETGPVRSIMSIVGMQSRCQSLPRPMAIVSSTPYDRLTHWDAE